MQSLLLVLRVILLVTGILEPVNERLHLLHEDGASLGLRTLLGPVEDRALGQDVVLVQQLGNGTELLDETGILVKVDLDRLHQSNLRLGRGAEGGDQLAVLLNLLQNLVVDLIRASTPVNRSHHSCPDQWDELGLGQTALLDLSLQVGQALYPSSVHQMKEMLEDMSDILPVCSIYKQSTRSKMFTSGILPSSRRVLTFSTTLSLRKISCFLFWKVTNCFMSSASKWRAKLSSSRLLGGKKSKRRSLIPAL